jgi:putative transposase
MRVSDGQNSLAEKEILMKRYSPEQIVSKLRQADVELGKGHTVKEVCRKIEVTEQTYYRWRQKYGGMSPGLVKELKTFQRENHRLRKIIADQRIDLEIMKEAIAYDSKNS